MQRTLRSTPGSTCASSRPRPSSRWSRLLRAPAWTWPASRSCCAAAGPPTRSFPPPGAGSPGPIHFRAITWTIRPHTSSTCPRGTTPSPHGRWSSSGTAGARPAISSSACGRRSVAWSRSGARRPRGSAWCCWLRSWMESHAVPWVHEECAGGHEIFPECVPRVAEFFMGHPRNLYRGSIHARGGGPLRFDTADAHPEWNRSHTWRPGRPIAAGSFHWLRLEPLPPGTPADEAVQEVVAVLRDDNTIELASANARRMRIHLHPRMLDLTRPITATVNGAVVFRGRVEPQLALMLRLVREFDDRGRIFHAAIDLEVPSALRSCAPRA